MAGQGERRSPEGGSEAATPLTRHLAPSTPFVPQTFELLRSLLRLNRSWRHSNVTGAWKNRPREANAGEKWAMTWESVVANYGKAAKAKFAAPVAASPERRLDGPLTGLVTATASLVGLTPAKLVLSAESPVAELEVRPDFAVTYRGALVGFIEAKAPGKGANPKRFKDKHDKGQWAKLAALPNLLYTDGNEFGLYRDGELQGSIIRVDGDVETSGTKLAAPPQLAGLIEDFLRWEPIPPKRPGQLADMTARLCRLLRDEVLEQLAHAGSVFDDLRADWRQLLFPEATDKQFADGYAQAVTFGLLIARAAGIDLSKGVAHAGAELGPDHTLIGAALRVMADDTIAKETLTTSARTLTRVLNAVDWPTIAKGDPDAWLYFYEDFLAEYDPKLRKETGSYYTPPEVVTAMVRMADEAVVTRLGRPKGLATDDVTLVDPAMGTGTFLLRTLDRIAEAAKADYGAGHVPTALAGSLKRLIGFELQVGPYAVAQLRVLAHLADLGVPHAAVADARLYVADTLGNPYETVEHLPTLYRPIAASRIAANKVKADEPVVVVIGNPPYAEKAKGRGGWIEKGHAEAKQDAPLDAFQPPKDWGVGTHTKHLRNLYVYFWRWATWKVFDQHLADDRGVIAFITVAGFLNGPGFQGMRAYLRKRADAVWVIDCSPEGHQAPVNSRIFQGVQHPVCITIVVRDGSTGPDEPAEVHYRRLAAGDRKEKFVELAGIGLTGDGWELCGDDARAPFLPAGGGQWLSFVALDDLFRYDGSGVMPGRTWVIAPDAESLHARWEALIDAPVGDKPRMLMEHRRDRRVDTIVSEPLPGHAAHPKAIADETSTVVDVEQYGFRSFDRQWIIADKRVINQPNPNLWEAHSGNQIYLTAPHDRTPTGGPAATATDLVPDLHHYHGRGGRVFPLWLDAAATVSNLNPDVLAALSGELDSPVTGPEVFVYITAVLAQPAYTERFADDLSTPGLRVPLTTDADVFARAVALGQRVLWLHTYGERCTDAIDGRLHGAPRVPNGQGPAVVTAVPSTPEKMPDTIDYDAQNKELRIGDGVIGPVRREVVDYEVSGVNVLDKWFSYRRRNRERPTIGTKKRSPLEAGQSEAWLAAYTEELIDLLHVLTLLVDLQDDQAALLDEILDGPLLTEADLTAAGHLPRSASVKTTPVKVAAKQAAASTVPEGSLNFTGSPTEET